MPKLICVSCSKEMKPDRNGVYYLEYANFGPYKLWHSDMWGCPKCGHQVLSGFGYNPISEHYQDRFNSDILSLRENPNEVLIEEDAK
jgi:hypothetical protein